MFKGDYTLQLMCSQAFPTLQYFHLFYSCYFKLCSDVNERNIHRARCLDATSLWRLWSAFWSWNFCIAPYRQLHASISFFFLWCSSLDILIKVLINMAYQTCNVSVGVKTDATSEQLPVPWFGSCLTVKKKKNIFCRKTKKKKHRLVRIGSAYFPHEGNLH